MSNLADRHPATQQLLDFFAYDHLPPALAAVSKPFSDLAHNFADSEASGPEMTVCLRKMLEAKDCAVRAHVAAKKVSANA